ncbi:MAG: hypothetical protein VKJ02_04025 [Snowella sp.]|nr:hypothetical protein [Snowella sp.]
MPIKHWIFAIFLSLGITINLIPKLSAMETMGKTAQPQFQKIEQPWELKTVITLGGLALVGLELWWFLGSKSKEI